MSRPLRWFAGISGSVVAGITAAYLGIGALLSICPDESVELEGDAMADDEPPRRPWDAAPVLGGGWQAGGAGPPPPIIVVAPEQDEQPVAEHAVSQDR